MMPFLTISSENSKDAMRFFRCFVRDCLDQEALSSPSEELSSLLSEELFDGSSSSFSTTVFFREIEAVSVFGCLDPDDLYFPLHIYPSW